MRKWLLVAPLLLVLGACSTNQPPPASIPAPPQQPASDTGSPSDATPIHGVTPGHKCTTDGTTQFIGQQGTEATGDAVLKASNAAVLRWAPPGVMLTMDYREDRVTIWLDPSKKITKIRCG
jgi:hypothetical protein